MSLSGDGNTLAVGASFEDSDEKGVDGSGGNDLARDSGAVYVFAYSDSDSDSDTPWSEQAYLKAINAEAEDLFGTSVSLSADGNTLAVGAYGEKSNAIGIGGDHGNNGKASAGAAYVFIRSGADWTPQAYIKAHNTDSYDNFGFNVSISADGNTLAVSASNEDSNAVAINGIHSNNEFLSSGAVYTFARSAATWSAQAYIKANTTHAGDHFGSSVALSADGGTLAVGAGNEASGAIGVNRAEDNNKATNSGAVYVY